MRKTALLLSWLAACPTLAFATWSVIAVDRATGRVVIASSTCTGTTDDFLKDVQAVVVPGKGVAACQAGVDGTHQNQTLVFDELKRGTEPARIIEMLSQDPGFQSRQFGIVDLQGRMAGHSGLTNGFVTQDMHGQAPGTEIFYSIQGNILRTGGVVPGAVKAFLAATGGITDRVMAAMEAADAAGGDSRCTCQTPAAPAAAAGIPCTYRTTLVAYILAADPGDTNGAADQPNSHNNGKYSMYITVSQPGQGPEFQIKAGENLNPVKTLRMRYDVAAIILRPDGSGAYGGGSYDIIGPTGSSLGYRTVAAKAGDSIALLGTGFGPTKPTVLAGQAFSGAAATTSPVAVRINSTSVAPSFAGLSGAGLYQINLTVPAGLGTGDVPLQATVAGVQTPSGVAISLQ